MIESVIPHSFCGILNIHKPPGLTSRRIVDRVEELVTPSKAGHAGTLDPMATGVLIVCVGKATRLIDAIQLQAKEYRARFILGKQSNTDDMDGAVIDMPNTRNISRDEFETVLPKFIGNIEQVPPQYSAVHIEGKRAYELARKGRTFDIQPRRVNVHRITLTEFDFPEVELEIECGSGTYIRSIGRDLGKLLGCGGVMSSLIRTRIGPYSLNAAIELDQLNAETLPQSLLAPVTAVVELPKYHCDNGDLDHIRHGRQLKIDAAAGFEDEAAIAVITPDGDLACLARFRGLDDCLRPYQVFLAQH